MKRAGGTWGRIAGAGLCAVGLALPVWAQEAAPKRFDHALFLHLETTPPGADVYATATGGEARIRLGKTPCVVPVGFSWEERFGRKQWKTMRVWTKGDICRLEPAEGDAFDLWVRLEAEKEGCHRRTVDERVATLKNPGLSFDLAATWPRELRLKVELEPLPAPAQKEAPPPARVPSLVMASAAGYQGTDLGTVEVRCNVTDAVVLVNGRIVSQAPVNLVLPEGTYRLGVQREGYLGQEKHILVKPDKRYRWNVDLLPRPR